MSSLFTMKDTFVLILQYLDEDDVFCIGLHQVCRLGMDRMLGQLKVIGKKLSLFDMLIPCTETHNDNQLISKSINRTNVDSCSSDVSDSNDVDDMWNLPITRLVGDDHPDTHPARFMPYFLLPRYHPPPTDRSNEATTDLSVNQSNNQSFNQSSFRCFIEYHSLYYRMQHAVDGLSCAFPYSCASYRHRQQHEAPAISLQQMPCMLRQLLASFVSKQDDQRALSNMFSSAFNGMNFITNAEDLHRSIPWGAHFVPPETNPNSNLIEPPQFPPPDFGPDYVIDISEYDFDDEYVPDEFPEWMYGLRSWRENDEDENDKGDDIKRLASLHVPNESLVPSSIGKMAFL